MHYKVIESKLSDKGHLSGNLEHLETNKTEKFIVFSDKVTDTVKKDFRQGNVISLLAYDVWKDNKVPTRVEVVKEAKIGLSLAEQEEYLTKIKHHIYWFDDNQQQKPLSQKLSSLIAEFESLFKIAPAATSNHHNYLGGLLVHIDEVIEKAIKLNDLEFDYELLIAGCVLHDFAKTWEYSIDPESGLIEYNKDWIDKNISHTHWAYKWAIRHEFDELADVVASHHGRVEWGALFEPRTPEAWMIHLADMASSRLGKLIVEQLEG